MEKVWQKQIEGQRRYEVGGETDRRIQGDEGKFEGHEKEGGGWGAGDRKGQVIDEPEGGDPMFPKEATEILNSLQ